MEQNNSINEMTGKFGKAVCEYYLCKINGRSLGEIHAAFNRAKEMYYSYAEHCIADPEKRQRWLSVKDDNSLDSYLTGQGKRIYEERQNAVRGVEKTESFSDPESANNWLRNTKGIAEVKCSFETKRKLGLFANNQKVSHVSIKYRQVGYDLDYYFRIAEIKKTNLFVRGNGQYIHQIRLANRGKEIVDYVTCSSSRQNASAFDWKFDTSRVEHENYIIVYKVKNSDPDPVLKRG